MIKNILAILLLVFTISLVSSLEVSKWDYVPEGNITYNNNTFINQTIELNDTQFDILTTPVSIDLTWLTIFIEGVSKWLNYYNKSEVYNKTEIDAKDLEILKLNEKNYINIFDDFITNGASPSTTYTPHIWFNRGAINSGRIMKASYFTAGVGGGAYQYSLVYNNTIGVIAIASRITSGTANSGSAIYAGVEDTLNNYFTDTSDLVTEYSVMFPTYERPAGTVYISDIGKNSEVKIGFIKQGEKTGAIFVGSVYFMMLDGVLTINNRDGGATRQTDITAVAGLVHSTFYKFKIRCDVVNSLDYFTITDSTGSIIYAGNLTHNWKTGSYGVPSPTIIGLYTPSTVDTTYGVPIVFLDYSNLYSNKKIVRFGE